MKNARNNTAIAIALFLMLTMAVSLVALPPVNAGFDDPTTAAIAAGMTWPPPGAQYADLNATSARLLNWDRYKDEIPCWVFAVISPNPVGVGQQFSIVMFNPQQPPGALAVNDVRYTYNIIIDKPEGPDETLPTDGGVFTSDSTGTSYTLYTPDQVGNYTVTVRFNELFYDWTADSAMRDFYGVTFKEATYSVDVVVQEEKVIPAGWTPTPLPTEYWTRPIEGQNTDWWRVASNWLGNAHDMNNGMTENRYQQDGTAPNSGHILWTKVTEDGGLVGGGNFSVAGDTFNAGHQYQTRFTKQIIMMGRLYYELPITWAGTGGGWMCVDLRTGEDLWGGPRDFGTAETSMVFSGVTYTFLSTVAPSFGYYYDWDDMNQHGIVNPSWIFTMNFGQSIHPRYGTFGQLNLTNVPSGYEIMGPKGEVLRYVIENAGNSTHQDYRLLQWNSSRVFTSQTGKIPANCPTDPGPSNRYWNGSMWVTSSVRNAQGYASVTTTAYDWNISAPWRNNMQGGNTITTQTAVYGDVLLGSNGSLPTGTNAPNYAYPSSVTMWAINLNPDRGAVGNLMWMEEIDTVTKPADGGEMIFERAAEGVIIFVKLPERRWIGYSMYTGKKLWEAAAPEADFNPFGYFSFPSLIHVASSSIAYGKLFTGGYTGAVHCYDLNNGTLLWRYEAPTDQEIFPYYTLMLGPICDGKIYVGTHEHSADTPLFKGNKVRALNVTTGEEVWTMAGWAHPYTLAVADGILVYWNNYDHQVYAVGKGPTATTVTASPKVSTHGSSVLVEGTVIDISAGTKQNEQAARFPNGVPAVSEESMSAWMEYVYMQKARPANATGVEVILTVLDPNNNVYDIGTATSDASGNFKLLWEPLVPGEYTVIATFAGSEGYWQSFAETAVGVTEALEVTPPPTAPPASNTDMYVTGFGIGIIIAIVAGIAVLVLMLRKR